MFTWLLEKSLGNRLLVVLGALLLMAYGALALRSTPVDVFPDLNQPTVTLMTEAGGMAAEEVEQLITLPLENTLRGLPGVQSIRSVSSAGLSFVYLAFDWDSEIYRARQLVAERLAAMEASLPPGRVPHMGPVSSVMGEILQIAIPVDPQQLSAMAVREVADWVLRPRLLALPGVAQVIPIGGELRQFQVQPDPQRMRALGVELGAIQAALRGYAANTSGGFVERQGRELLIRHLAGAPRLEDLRLLAVSARDGRTLPLQQVAEVSFAAAPRRGDAGFGGQPAVILGVQKQPATDTLALTRAVEQALVEMRPLLPAGMAAPQVSFRQASFIEASIATLQGKLLGAAVVVAGVLLVFLGALRPTLIALTAIPVSLLATLLVFQAFGLSINTMTLGGLAIAIGGLVDDAVVDVENILRRLREARQRGQPFRLLALVRQASLEVRSGIVLATVILVLVFVPLFALPGLEGRLFLPLGVAFIVSTLASLLVSVTLTPVLSAWLLPGMKRLDHGETQGLRRLKAGYGRLLTALLSHPQRARAAVLAGGLAVLLAGLGASRLPTSFLPPFNEGTLLVGLRLNPGVTLSESSALARQAEQLLLDLPEVVYVGRRSGRAELDEHAEGVHVSELDVGLKPAAELGRSMDAIQADIRRRLASLPAAVAVGQPISHRIDHMLSGVRSQIAIKLFGEDLDALRAEAERLRERLAGVPGLADLEVEKQVLAPQIQVRVDAEAAARHGISTGTVLAQLQTLVEGETLSQLAEGPRRFALVLRLPDAARGVDGLQQVLIDTPQGAVPLARLATVEEGDGPNQISRDEGRRRIVLSASASGRPLSEVVAEIRERLAAQPLPAGLSIVLGGQFQAQAEAARRIGLLALLSLGLMFAVLYSRYRSARLSALVMLNIPLALVGAVAGLALAGQPLSVAALVGLITLAGIAVRNGILKLSHWLNLMRLEGEAFGLPLVVRGAQERLSPVLMTALVTALALAPLLFEAERPGTEILHPVAVVIFSGLLSATLLDTFLSPALFWLFGRREAERLAAGPADEAL